MKRNEILRREGSVKITDTADSIGKAKVANLGPKGLKQSSSNL